MRRVRPFSLLMTLLLAPICGMADGKPAGPPSRFLFSVSHMGTSNELQIVGGRLKCTRHDRGSTTRPKMRQPTPEDWRRLRQVLDDANVWRWRPSYSPQGVEVMDGQLWSLEVRYADAAVTSRGYAEYPAVDGSLAAGPEKPSVWFPLRKALVELAPGCLDWRPS